MNARIHVLELELRAVRVCRLSSDIRVQAAGLDREKELIDEIATLRAPLPAAASFARRAAEGDSAEAASLSPPLDQRPEQG